MGPQPRLVIETFSQNASTFGPSTRTGVIYDALKLGWSWYSRYPSNAFWTLRQDSPSHDLLEPLKTHILVWYMNDRYGIAPRIVFSGRLTEPNSSGDDVIYSAWNYLSDLSLSRTGYRIMYQGKILGSELVAVEWNLAKTISYGLLTHVATGTIENPLASDGVTEIKTDARFGVADVSRLLFMYDMTEIGRANTTNNVTMEITRTPPFTFNFWKNRGTAQTATRLTFPGNVNDYRHVPGYSALRNDLATIGTSTSGGAVEIIKTDETSAAEWGRRQDVFVIKTLMGQAGATSDQDAQTAITERAVKEATQLGRALELDLRDDIAPFDGYDLEDTVRTQVKRGRDNIDADYRIIGVTGLQDADGYHPGMLVQLPTAA